MKVAIKTLGCKLNQAESEEIAEKLRSFGISLVSPKEKADLYLINTCSITALALKKSRQEIHKIRNKYKNAKIWACGCGEELKNKVDKFFDDKNKISKTIIKDFYKPSLDNKALCLQKSYYGNYGNQRTRAFLKIQDGCDNFCSYCIIPYRRGKPKSVESSEIIKKINQKVKEGFKEVILEGVNILKYKDKKMDFCNLVEKILSKTKIERIRFGSIDPRLVTERFIRLFRSNRVCKHMHLSLQSGSDKILKKMNRGYKISDYLKIVNKLYQLYPDFGFTTDVIVGFPTETDKDFNETYNLIKKVKFLKVHIFRYSKRAGTKAANLSETCSEGIKKERAKKLALLNKKLKKDFDNRMIGKKLSVLFESKKDNYWYGFTDNYVRVKLASNLNLKNQIKEVKISKNNLN